MQDPDLDSDERTDDLFDFELRDQIINGIEVHTAVSETDISERLRQQRNEMIVKVLGGIAVIAVLVGAVLAFRAYRESTIFLRTEDFSFVVGQRYTFEITQDGEYLIDGFLDITQQFEQGGHTFYGTVQGAPGTDDSAPSFWSIRDDGFYQFINSADKHPQLMVKLPLRPGTSWSIPTYPGEKESTSRQSVETHFTAGEEITLELPIGSITCIEITVLEEGADEPTKLWISREAPIVQLNLEFNGDPIVARLKEIKLPSA